MRVYSEAAADLAADQDFDSHTRVLFWLIANNTKSNVIRLAAGELAKRVGISDRMARLAISRLESKGLLIKLGRKGVMLNPKRMACGSRQHRGLLIKRWAAVCEAKLRGKLRAVG